MIIGDLNINTKCNNYKLYHLTELCDVFDLSNLIYKYTCSKSSEHTPVGVNFY